MRARATANRAPRRRSAPRRRRPRRSCCVDSARPPCALCGAATRIRLPSRHIHCIVSSRHRRARAAQRNSTPRLTRRPPRTPPCVGSSQFLLLDELGPTDYAPGEFKGAPWHPHRGFDTVMYLKQGEGKHQDSMGNSGILRAGDVQWMTAASGIEHDEGRDHPGGTLHGFQCWVNLPRQHKMDAPHYQDVPSCAIPVTQPAPGVSAKIIAGCDGDARCCGAAESQRWSR